MTTPPHTNPLDLGIRLGGLQLARALIAALAVAAATVMPDRFGLAAGTVVAWSVAYAVTTTALEVVRRAARARLVALASVLLVVDALFVALVSVFDGGPTGPLSFLPVLHVVAVVFLAGPASGLRVAVAHVLLLFIALVQHTADGTARDDPSAYALAAVGILSVAVVLVSIQGVVDRAHRRRNERLAALSRLADACQQAPSSAEIVESLVTTVCDAFGFEDGTVVLDAPGEKVDHAVSLVRRLGPEHEPLRTALGDPTNVVLVPLRGEGRQRLGLAAFVAGTRARGFPGEDVQLVERFCAHASLAIGNARLRAEIERLATTDPLTGLANRRRFEEVLAAEVVRTRRHGVPFAVVTVDVDHFKSVNDTHGHAVGDDVLVAVAGVLADECRATDLAARTGGEEFVVLLPETDLPHAAVLADRIRQAVKADSGPISVTISAGVAAFPETSDDAHRLLVAADEALYQAKTQGRDQVCTAPPAEASVPSGAVPPMRGRRRTPLRAASAAIR